MVPGCIRNVGKIYARPLRQAGSLLIAQRGCDQRIDNDKLSQSTSRSGHLCR